MAGSAPAPVVITYAGGDTLRIAARGHEMLSDQPVEDGGDDTAPTPTEIFIAGLGACVAFYAERFLRRNGLSTDGLKVECSHLWAENPHRVGEIELLVDAPGLTDARRAAFSRVIDHCTIHNTLRQPPAVRVVVSSTQTAAV
ncbi:MAG TPA: OsmC family protein [Candidatus Dormibacteraeota bacterium]|nr:OsmC family protein [Candidatus Dormibacteraeota bacterium]